MRTARNKPSAIFTQAQVDHGRAHFERGSALMLLALSIFGSVLAFNPVAWSLNGVIAGIGVQVVCTAIEWWWRHKRLSVPYGLAFMVDTGTTIAGFGPIFHDWLAVQLPIAAGLASWIAWGIIAVAAMLLAFIPEGRLID
jgi:hypothetical protein